MNTALLQYNSHKFKKSSISLEDIDSHSGCSDKVHYYLALNYLNLNQTVLAQLHHQWVMSNSKKLVGDNTQTTETINWHTINQIVLTVGKVPYRPRQALVDVAADDRQLPVFM